MTQEEAVLINCMFGCIWTVVGGIDLIHSRIFEFVIDLITAFACFLFMIVAKQIV